jgi:hypothetical protein
MAHAPARLSERRLQQMIDALQGTMPHRQGLRHWPRLNLEGYVTLQPLGASERENPREVGVYDISRTGMAVVDDRSASPGEQFSIQIPRRMHRPVEILCTVRNCRPERSYFVIGAEYGASSLNAMHALIMPAKPSLALAR